MSSINSSLQSFTYIPRAIKYLFQHPKLYPFVIIPFLLNLIFGTILFFVVLNTSKNSLSDLLNFDFLTQLKYFDQVISVFSVIFALLLATYLSVSLAIVIQSPFNGLIVEKIFADKGITDKMQLSGFKMLVYDIKRSLQFEIQKLLLLGSVLCLSLLLNIIPVIGNLLFVIIGFASTYLFNLMDLLDPGLDRFDLNLKQKINKITHNLDTTFAAGLLLHLVINIPIVNFLLLPILFTSAGLLISETKSLQ